MVTFRFDDISSNTDMLELDRIIAYLAVNYKCNFLFAVNILSQSNDKGSIYKDVPFKDKSFNFFYKVDSFFELPVTYKNVASHGLLHIDHSKLSGQAQQMSILTSCNFLKTKIFVPPFNRFNETTQSICDANDIKLEKLEDGWLSIEHNNFNSNHKLWYLHPWKWTLETLKDYLGKDMGQLQTDSSHVTKHVAA